MTKDKINQHEIIIEILSSITALKKEKDNPFFKSKYVDLPTILQEVKPILFKNQCYPTQQILSGDKTTLKTKITHVDGTVLLECEAPIPVKDINNPQNWGSAITFMKRYSLTSLLGIEEEDDDGNKGTKTAKTDHLMMEVLNLFLAEKLDKCLSSNELKSCWKNNKKYVDKLKEESQKDYDKLVKKVKTINDKFTEAEKPTADVTQEAPKDEPKNTTGLNAVQPNPKDIKPEEVNNKPLTDEEKKEIENE